MMFGYVFHDTNGQNGITLIDLQFLLRETYTDTHLLVICGKGSSKKFCWNLDGKKYRFENVFSQKNTFSLSVYVDDIKMSGKKQNMPLMWKK